MCCQYTETFTITHVYLALHVQILFLCRLVQSVGYTSLGRYCFFFFLDYVLCK